MTFKISKKNSLLWLYLGGALLLVAAATVWCIKTSMDPERVFWRTFNEGLSLSGVTVSGEQGNGQTTAKQTIQYSFGARNLSRSLTVLSQGNTVVSSEVLGTPTVDYTRYTGITTDQKHADGSKLDTSNIIGVWAKGEEGMGQFFSQAAFGTSLPIGGMVVPMGNLTPQARAKVLNEAKDKLAYGINFTTVKKERVHGRLLYTYEASIRPAAYVSVMRLYAQIVGIHGLEQVNPDDYKAQPPFKLRITIDARAAQITTIASDAGGSMQQYSSYGVPVQAELPAHPITAAELQKRLASLQ